MFIESVAPQGSPEWIALRFGKVTASRLADWLAMSKGGDRPLKARLDYEKELAYERAFNTTYDKFVTQAMQDGIDFEDYIRGEYEKHAGVEVKKSGLWYNDLFGASPDGLVGKDGLIEIKTLGDASFMDVLTNGVPEKYYLQMQGQMYATGRKWCDFVAGNIGISRFTVIRVERDEDTIKRIEDSLEDSEKIEPLDITKVYKMTQATPEKAQEDIW